MRLFPVFQMLAFYSLHCQLLCYGSVSKGQVITNQHSGIENLKVLRLSLGSKGTSQLVLNWVLNTGVPGGWFPCFLDVQFSLSF